MNNEETTGANPNGKRTRELLEKKGIKSPELKRMVRVNNRTWIEIPESFNDSQVKQFIKTRKEEMSLIIVKKDNK